MLLGISIPTTSFPGIGAWIRIERARNAIAKSSSRVRILLTLICGAGRNSKVVTIGPE